MIRKILTLKLSIFERRKVTVKEIKLMNYTEEQVLIALKQLDDTQLNQGGYTKNFQEKKMTLKIEKAKELLEKEGYKVTKAGETAEEWIKIPGTDYEITRDVLYKGKTYNEIMNLKQPEEELLTLELIGIICKDKELLRTLKMDSSSTNDDFFFKQPFPQNEARGYVAWFVASSDDAYLNCGRYSDGADSMLGVRFARKISAKKK